jgi:hypothetical protein
MLDLKERKRKRPLIQSGLLYNFSVPVRKGVLIFKTNRNEVITFFLQGQRQLTFFINSYANGRLCENVCVSEDGSLVTFTLRKLHYSIF